MLHVKVSNFEGAKDQFIIETNKGVYFQSYDSIIALKSNGKIYLDKNTWDYSRTTTKYLNRFLGNTDTIEVKTRIETGKYILTNLNK
jgi:hypothetical protein